MNGDTHNFYAVIMGTILITLISGFNSAFGKGSWIGIITNIVALVLYGSATLIDNAEKKREKKNKEEHKEHLKIGFVQDGITKGKKIAMLMLYLNVIVVCAVASFNNEEWIGSNITIAILSIILVIAGAFTPDLDTLLFGINVHRNPLSHSWVVPTILWTLGMVSYNVGDKTFIFIGMYCVGCASHLMLDTIPSTAGFFEGIKEFFSFTHAPGDIRVIPEKWEHYWLSFGSMGLFALFGTTIARFYGSVGFTYDVEGDWNASTIAIVVIGSAAVLLWFALMFIAKFVEKKKPSKRSTKGYSKRPPKKEEICDTNDAQIGSKEYQNNIQESIESDAKVVTKKTTRKKKTTEPKN